MPLDLARTDREDLTTLHISGALDASTASELQPLVDQIVGEGRTRVVVDLAGLEKLDSVGVAGIVGLYRHVHALGGSLEVVHARDQPRAMIQQLRLDRVFAM